MEEVEKIPGRENMRKNYKKPEFIMSYFNFGNDIMLSSATPETLFTKGVRIDTIRANLNS